RRPRPRPAIRNVSPCWCRSATISASSTTSRDRARYGGLSRHCERGEAIQCCRRKGKLDCFVAIAPRNDGDGASAALSGNRQLGRRIEKVQAAELRRNAHLVAGSDFHFRGDTGDGETVGADARLQQDFRTELLDDFDAGIEAGAGGALANGEML